MQTKKPSSTAPAAGKPGAAKPGAPSASPVETPVADAVARAAELFPQSGATAGAGGSPIVEAFVEKLLPCLLLGKSASQILQSFSSIDVTSDRFAEVLKANPHLLDHFERVLLSLANREQMPPPESIIVLLGMQNSRNLATAIQLQRAVRRQHPEWTKEGRLKVASADILKLSVKVEERLTAFGYEYVDAGFAASVVFDLLALAAQDLADDKKKVAAFIESVHEHGMKVGGIAVELSRGVPGFSGTKQVYAAALVHDVGKAAMAILDKSYVPWLDEMSKRAVPRILRTEVERRQFGIDHAELGALVCDAFNSLRSVSRVIQYHHRPWLLQEERSADFQLAAVVSIATTMASKAKRLEAATDPIVQEWKGPGLEKFSIEAKAWIEASVHTT